MPRLSNVEGLSAPAAGRHLDEMVKEGTLLREVTRAGRERTARFTLLPGCDTDELTQIAEALGAGREALLLRVALLMDAISVDARLLANLDAFMPLCLGSDRKVPSDGQRQELLVHLRALCTLARRSQPKNEEQVAALDTCCATLEKRWNLPEHLINAQVDQRITAFKLQSLPPLMIPGSPRGTPRDDGFDLSKMLARFRGEKAPLSSPLTSRFTRDTRLEQVVTGWLNDGTLQCLITNDDPVLGSVSRFVLGPDAPAYEVAAVATVLKDSGEWHLALLWWAAWAMNANRPDEAFILVVKTVLVLEDCIALPPVSTWDELSRLCAHAMALQLLRLKRGAVAPDLQDCIDKLLKLVTLEHQLFPQVLARANSIIQRLPEDVRTSDKLRRRIARIEALAIRARAEHGLEACGLGGDERATCLAKPERLDVVMRLLLQGNLQPRVESSPRDGFRGFDAMRRAEPGDVVTLASVFAGVERPALALQLLAAHLTQLAALNGEDLACVSSAVDIARNIDPKDGAAVQAIRSILLHIRLLLHCEVATVQQLELVDVDAVDDRPLEDQEIREIEAGNDQVEVLREFEAALLTCLRPGTAETVELLPIGDVDGLCHILERMAGDPHLVVGPRRAVLMQAAVQWASTCTGPARDGILQAWAHANGLPAGGEDLASQSLERRRASVLQLDQQLKEAAFTFEMQLLPDGESWQRQLIVPRAVQVPVDCCLAYAAAVLRRSGRTPAGQAACWVPLLAGHVDPRDTPRRARLLVLALRAIEREPKVMAQISFSEAMATLLADHGVLSSLLDEMPDDLPSVVFSLVLAGPDSALHNLLHDCLKAISCSAAFASAMTRRSGAWMLDGALSCILAQPLLLQRPEVCEVLRCMATPPARSGSMKAMAMAVVMRLLRDHGAIGPALVECLAMQGLEARKQSAAEVMKCIEASEGASSGMTPRKDRVTRENLETLRSLLVENIVPRRRSVHSNPPKLVTQDPLLHSTWLGAGVADAIAGDGEHLLPMLADVHREQRKRRGNGWRESAEGLVFALQLFLRAAADQPDEVLDALICAQGLKGTAKLKSSEWMAFAGLVACQVVLKRRPVLIETSGVPVQLVQLARLMCAALSLEMRDPVACLRHLLEAQACEGEAEGPVGNQLFSTAWFARVRARLHTECLRRHPSVAW